MGFDGYFKLGGTEIINAARTKAYVDHMAPSFGLRDCLDCEGLPGAVGDGEVLSAVKRLSEESVVFNRWRNPAPRIATGTGFAAWGVGTGGETGTTIYAHNGATGVARENMLAFPYSMNPGPYWTFQAGTSEVVALSNSASGGPDNLVQGYIRRTVTTAKTATSSSGQFYRETGMTGLAGDNRMFSAWVRFSVSTSVSLGVQYRVGATIVTATNGTPVIAPANTWMLLQVELAATANYDTLQIWAATQQIIPVGGTYDMAAVGAENPATFKGNIFHAASNPYFDQGTVHVTFAAATTPARAQMLYGVSPGAVLTGQPWFGRRVIQAPKTAGSSGWQATSTATRAYFSAPVGSTLSAAASIRYIYSDGMSVRLRMVTYDAGGNPIQQADSTPYILNSGDEARMEVSFPVTAEFVSVGIWAYQTSGGGSQTPSGASIVDFGSIFVSTDAPSTYPWFDGGATDTADTDYAWMGAVSNSASVKRVYEMGREVLQDGGYSTPLNDGAPWMDSSNPDLRNFWGVQPLAVDGLDDSTRTTTVTELTTDGAVMSIPRSRAREIRFDAMLVGADDAAVDAGFHWLNRALDALRCDNTDLGCTGTELHFFSTCPPLCDYSGCSDTPVAWTYDNTNLDAERSAWSGSAGGRANPFADSRTDGACSWSGLSLTFFDTASTVTRAISGLIPGQRYVIDMRAWAGTGRSVTMSISGLPASTVVSPGLGCPWFNLTGGPWVLEFTATSSMHLLVLETTHVGLTGSISYNFPMVISSINVTRVGAPVTAYQTSFPNDGSDSNGWSTTLAVPANITYVADRSFQWNSSIPLTARWTASAAVVLPAGTGLQRPLRGLTPGEEYTVRVFMPNAYFGTGFGTAVGVRMNIDGLAAGPTVTPGNGTSNGAWLERTFVAQSERHVLSVVRTTSTTLASGENLSMTFLYARVQRSYASEQLNAVTAGGVERYERILYQVTALTGPTITERFDKETGSMMRVSFGLVAGVPHQFGPTTEVGSAIGGSAINLVEVDCFEGQAIRRNLVSNPSFETATTGWANSGGTMTRANLGAGNAPFGAYSLRVTSMITGGSIDNTVPIPVLGGAQYTFSSYWRWSGPVGATKVRMYPWITWRNAAGSAIRVDSGFGNQGDWDNDIDKAVWSRGFMRLIAPIEATTVLIRMQYDAFDFGDPVIDPSTIIDWDAFMLEDGNIMTPYFDGSTPNGHWTGAAHLSPSYWVATATSDLIDPDCPPLPSPPAPPQITDSCVDFPDSWTRYTIPIPASDVPLFSSALPVVTVSTGNASARQLRMRWYPNRDNQDIGELEPCAYDGEIIVSYMPPDADMIIDAITHTAVALTNAQATPQTATQLLYGPDGGPMVWPELSCNVPYIFTLDVDSAASVTELDVQLSLGLKV